MGKELIDRVINEQGEILTDSLLQSLHEAESSLELLVHLGSQMKVNRIRPFGTGPSNKAIVFIRNRLIDDFEMTDEQIELELVRLRKEL